MLILDVVMIMWLWAVHEKIGTIFCLVGESVGGRYLIFAADSCCGLRCGSLFDLCLSS